MQEFRIISNLVPVGPRQNLARANSVNLALQLAGAYELEPAEAEYETYLEAACPWNFLNETSNNVSVVLYIYRASETPGVDAAYTDSAGLLPTVSAAFHSGDSRLADEFLKTFKKKRLSLKWTPPSAVPPFPPSETDFANAEPAFHELLHQMATHPPALVKNLNVVLYLPAVSIPAGYEGGKIIASPLIKLPIDSTQAKPNRILRNQIDGSSEIEYSSSSLFSAKSYAGPPLDLSKASHQALQTLWCDVEEIATGTDWINQADQRATEGLDLVRMYLKCDLQKVKEADPNYDLSLIEPILFGLLLGSLYEDFSELNAAAGTLVNSQFERVANYLLAKGAQKAVIEVAATTPFTFANWIDAVNAILQTANIDGTDKTIFQLPSSSDDPLIRWQQARRLIKILVDDPKLRSKLMVQRWEFAVKQDSSVLAAWNQFTNLDEIFSEHGLTFFQQRRLAKVQKFVGKLAGMKTAAEAAALMYPANPADLSFLRMSIKNAISFAGLANDLDVEQFFPAVEWSDSIWDFPNNGMSADGLPIAVPFLQDKGNSVGFDEMLRQISGFGLLIKRTSETSWHIVNTGLVEAKFAQPPGSHTLLVDSPVLIPIRPVFNNTLLRPQVVYQGFPIGAEDPIASVREELVESLPEGIETYPDELYRFTPSIEKTTSGWKGIANVFQVPALRCGDSYNLTGFVIDSTGFGPAAMTDVNNPYVINPSVEGVSGFNAITIDYRRAAKVGQINITPTPSIAGDHLSSTWQQIPKDVIPRANEVYSKGALAPGADANPPLVLLHCEQNDKLDTKYEFLVGIPTTTEHVIKTYAAPAYNDGNKQSQAKRINNCLRQYLNTFHDTYVPDPNFVPMSDPAVVGIGCTLQVADAAETAFCIAGQKSLKVDSDGQLQTKRLSVKVSFDASNTGISTAKSDASLPEDDLFIVTLTKGAICYLEFFPLVNQSDYNSRFVPNTQTVTPWIGDNSTWQTALSLFAMEGAKVLVEVVDTDLPTPQELFDAFSIATNATGAVKVAIEPTLMVQDPLRPKAVRNIVKYKVFRKHWQWRGLPVVHAADNDNTAQEKLFPWGNAMVERPSTSFDVPLIHREITPKPGEIPVFLDDREGYKGSEFLHYSVEAASRYAGVLPKKTGIISSDAKVERVPYRGDKPKAPSILALVAMTSAFPDPWETKSTSTPRPGFAKPCSYLVVTNDIPFVECGYKETLRARVYTKKRISISGAESEITQIGPSPDHYFNLGNTLPLVNPTEKWNAANLDLKIWGPFGLTAETTAREVGMHAGCYVLEPPEGVAPHWLAEVEFARYAIPMSESPPVNFISKWTGPYQLYFQPDSEFVPLAPNELNQSVSYSPTGGLTIDRSKFLLMNPLLDVPPSSPSETPIEYIYRYYVLLTTKVCEFSGEPFGSSNTIAEIPFAVYRIDSSSTTMLTNARPRITPKNLLGRLVEIQVNRPYFAPPIDDITDELEFWKSLFPAPAEDADLLSPIDLPESNGMIRRISGAFHVNM